MATTHTRDWKQALVWYTPHWLQCTLNTGSTGCWIEMCLELFPPEQETERDNTQWSCELNLQLCKLQGMKNATKVNQYYKCTLTTGTALECVSLLNWGSGKKQVSASELTGVKYQLFVPSTSAVTCDPTLIEWLYKMGWAAEHTRVISQLCWQIESCLVG